jgi:hypothetical protein
MRYRTSATEHVESTRVSRLRLRAGVLLILLWLISFWALAPHIAHSLSGLSNPPSVAAVTTAIVAVQTILGLLGFWVAGTEVKFDHQGLHDEARPEGHLVHLDSWGRPRSRHRRRRSEWRPATARGLALTQVFDRPTFYVPARLSGDVVL